MYKKALSAILGDVLQREAIASHDNFFLLGLESLQAITVASRIQEELGLNLELIDILKHPSVQALNTLLVEQARTQLAALVTPVAERASYQTSPVQRGLYLMDKMTSRQNSAILPYVIDFDAALDPQVAEVAFREVLRRHEVLRTTFIVEHGIPVQIARTLEATLRPFEYTDISRHEYSAHQLKSLYEAAATEPFDLEAGPLVRFHLIRTSDSLCVAFLSIHHIVSDGFSALTIESDFRHYYDKEAGRRVVADGTSEPQPLLFQYKDYVYWLDEWTKGAKGEQSLKYWANALASYNATGVFTGGPATAVSFAGAREDSSLEEETLAKLRRVTVDYEVTTFVVLQCCIKVLLFLQTRKTDIVIGAAVTTRDSVPLSGQIGPFVNVVPIRTELSSDSTFKQLVSSVNEATLNAFAHKLFPIEITIERLNNGAPWFDVGFTLQKQGARARQKQASFEANTLSDNLAIKLLFIAFDSPSGIDIRIRYQTDYFARQEILQMRRQLTDLINALCDRSDEKLGDLFDLTFRENDYAIDLDLEF